MKTETQIAEENLKYYNKSFKNGLMSDLGIYQKELCQTHKASCERFLEFLEELINKRGINFSLVEDTNFFERMITDLKQAIKLCNEAGI